MQTGRGITRMVGGPPSSGLRPSARRAVLRYGPLMTTQEVALDGQCEVAFRSSARRAGPLGLILEGGAGIWSRPRLIGYLARFSLKNKGADTLSRNLE